MRASPPRRRRRSGSRDLRAATAPGVGARPDVLDVLRVPARAAEEVGHDRDRRSTSPPGRAVAATAASVEGVSAADAAVHLRARVGVQVEVTAADVGRDRVRARGDRLRSSAPRAPSSTASPRRSRRGRSRRARQRRPSGCRRARRGGTRANLGSAEARDAERTGPGRDQRRGAARDLLPVPSNTPSEPSQAGAPCTS